MPDRRLPLTPERLATLLDKLDDVMAEAARLRREVTRQLSEQRRSVQPQPGSSPRRKSKPR
jgi:hypothetical protein